MFFIVLNRSFKPQVVESVVAPLPALLRYWVLHSQVATYLSVITSQGKKYVILYSQIIVTLYRQIGNDPCHGGYSDQGYFEEFEIGGGIDKCLGGVNMRKPRIYIKNRSKAEKSTQSWGVLSLN